MPIHEIEIPGASFAVQVWEVRIPDLPKVFNEILKKQFSGQPEEPGFHDCDSTPEMIRGYFSEVVPFEVEHLVDGVTTKTLHKRIETAEFILADRVLFTWGKPVAAKLTARTIGAVAQSPISKAVFDFDHLNNLQNRMLQVKEIQVLNPWDKAVRKVKMAGVLEDYTEFNVLDPRNHAIASVKGSVETPLGLMTVTANKSGAIRLGVRRGLILTVDCLFWILALIREEKAPKMTQTYLRGILDQAADAPNRMGQIIRDGVGKMLKHSGADSITIRGPDGKEATARREDFTDGK
jgi:hypothetical protein